MTNNRKANIQSILFDRLTYTPDEAIIWLKNNGLVAKKIHTTEKYLRFRQYDPRTTDTYYTHDIGHGIKLILET